MSGINPGLVKSLKALIGKRAYDVRTKHIEVDRAWRQISANDVQAALKNAGVYKIKEGKIYFRGKDLDGREIEMQAKCRDKNNEMTDDVAKAHWLIISTAYEPGSKSEDSNKRDAWLKENPDWELASDGKSVRKKVPFETIS